ncbi:MAG TPA: right-handed parallel beta-helix repeat-containing protein [Verrucomicrobiae bacterium]|nr:right-handed parallel beta-helix repeat-containing protein [Verrucomicrobiae bacterium]
MFFRIACTALAGLLIAGCGTRTMYPAAEKTNRSVVFFVATNGNDAWSGQLAAAGSQHDDGPFATLPRAVIAARKFKSGQPNANVTIRLCSGIYFLNEPLVLTSEDSGLQIAAFRNEQPIISGGECITNWKAETLNGKLLWTADVPEVKAGRWMFHELWVNGRRAMRARQPNRGFFAVESLPQKSTNWMHGHTNFVFQAGDLKASPSLTNAEVVIMDRWVESRLPITGIDEARRVVHLGKRSVFSLEPGDLYFVENAFEALDAPGEWYLDPVVGKLFYAPRPDERLNRVEAIAPRLAQLIRLEGEPEKGRLIERLRFNGLSFSHAEWCFPERSENRDDALKLVPEPRSGVGGFGQAAIGVPAAIQGNGVCDSVFEHCTFAQLGGYALELARGCRSNRIENCEFTDLGAGGIKIGETVIRSKASDQTVGNVISHCEIQDGGNLFRSAVGIWIGQSANNQIVHNTIYNFYYTGISVGWTWGYGNSSATNNLFAFNHVHHLGAKTDGEPPALSDMGGIYTLGGESGTRIVNNLWHDIAGFRYGGWGIYFDEGSSGILAESNVVYRTTHGGFHQHYGETNIVRNNIFAFGRDHQIQRTRSENRIAFIFTNNIVYFDTGRLLAGNWQNDRFIIDGNIYWDTRLRTNFEDLKIDNKTLEQWRLYGHDNHSLIADPMFVAPERYDFRFKAGSPALERGFHPIDLRGVGSGASR